MTRYRYATTISFGTDGEQGYTEIDVEVSYGVAWGRPETAPAYSHGGLPADPDEITDLCLEKVNGKPRPWDMGYGFLSDDAFADMVTDKLEANFDDMIREAHEVEYDHRCEAAERRARDEWDGKGDER